MSIPKARIALIHVAKQQLGMAEEDYRAMLARVAGVRSAADLDARGFDAVMDEFERFGFRSTKGRVKSAQREGMASAAQIGKIRGLWQAYSGNDDDLRLGRWLEKHFHVSHVRFLEDWRAGKAIAILARMAERARAKRKGGGPGAPRAA